MRYFRDYIPTRGASYNTQYGTDEEEPAASADADATSGIYVPSSAAQFAALGLTAPDALWLCQETSGNVADSIGAFNLTASGTLTYENAAAGWDRGFIAWTDGVAGSLLNTSGSLPDPASASIGILHYGSVTDPAAIRSIVELFNSANGRSRINTTPRIAGFLNPATAVGGSDPQGAVRPFYVQYNFADSDFTIFTDQEKLTVAWAAQSGKAVRFGSAAAAAPMTMGYGLMYTGAKAEMSHAAVKTMLETLGWTVAW